MGEETVRIREDAKAKAMLTCSDTEGRLSPPALKPEKEEKGAETAEKKKQDKGMSHSAPDPLPRCSDSGKPTWRNSRRRTYSHEERKALRSVAFSFGNELLEMMSDDAMMARIRKTGEDRRAIVKALGFTPERPIRHAIVEQTVNGERKAEDKDVDISADGGWIYQKEGSKEAKTYDA